LLVLSAGRDSQAMPFERLLIHPSTFAVTLYDSEGQAIPRQRLSEGEKQLFAVAMLWGLAQASARPLPAVIDTPMARLDSAPRQNLVERYFPHASHDKGDRTPKFKSPVPLCGCSPPTPRWTGTTTNSSSPSWRG